MVNNPHVFEALPAYALGSLETDEAQQVADHLAGCFECRSEFSACQETADLLLLAVPEAAPAHDLKPRLRERIRAENAPRFTRPAQGPSRSRLAVAGMWAGVGLILLLAISSLWLWQRLENLEMVTGPLGMRAIALQNTTDAPEGSGFVIVSADGLNGVLVVDKLPPLDPGNEYQVWLKRGEELTSGAVFEVDEEGYRGVRLKAPDSLLEYGSVQVTIEPVGGSAAPTGPQVLAGSLFNK